MSPPLRILVMVNGEIGPRMSGPEIRGWEIARELDREHTVTIAAWNRGETAHEGVRVVPAGRRRLLVEALRHDVVIGASLPPYLLAALSRRDTLIVTDQYDPIDLELSTLGKDTAVTRAVDTQLAHRRLQLRHADAVVCAGQAQRVRLEEELRAVGRDGATALEVLPMGIPAPAQPADRHPLRSRFGLGEDDLLAFWWGSVWRWFDADTAVRAAARAAEEDPRVKLVITAPPSQPARRHMLSVDSARELAQTLGVLDRHVFFLEDWIDFGERSAYLQDADVGISLHRGTPEAEFAARARYMDYLWAGVPCILAEGDEVARDFGDAGFAWVVPPMAPEAVSGKLLELSRDRELVRAARAAGEPLADRYRWSRLVSDWKPRLEAAAGEGRRATRAGGLSAVAGYYGRRVVDRASSKFASMPAVLRS